MKNKYRVTIEESISNTFEIIAENEMQAREIAINNYNLGKSVLEPGELTHKQLQVSENNSTLIDWEEF